jgi:hypothetical protein
VWQSVVSLEIGILIHRPMAMVQGAIKGNDLVLWWCQWLLQAQLTIVFEKTLEMEVI